MKDTHSEHLNIVLSRNPPLLFSTPFCYHLKYFFLELIFLMESALFCLVYVKVPPLRILLLYSPEDLKY